MPDDIAVSNNFFGNPKSHLVSNGVAMAGGYYGDLDPGVSARPGFTRQDYEYFRPQDYIPKGNTQQDYSQIMKLCCSMYDRVGVVRSVIDLITDFAIDGLEIVHPDAAPNKFYAEWFKKVNMPDRAGQFARWTCKAGNVVVRRRTVALDRNDVAKIKIKDLALAADNVIPMSYVFYHPATVDIIGNGLSGLSNKKNYGIKLSLKSFMGIRHPKTDTEKQIFEGLPKEVQDLIMSENTQKGSESVIVPLPENEIFVGHYKKDDCDIWAKSFLYSVLGDVFYNDKVKLAKIAGLDGWCNSIRIWTLGDHKNNIYATPEMFNKLTSILEHNAGGGAMDLVWRSDIDIKESYPPVDKLANLNENINNILYGLGIPTSLVGGDSKGGQGDSMIMGMKNFVAKIAAVRAILVEWLNGEIDFIQKSMGFKHRPFIRFSNTNLQDERTLFNLLVQLADRDIISNQTLIERIKEVPELEKLRIESETASRKAGTLPEKASPYHKPDLPVQHEHEIKKIKVQTDNNIRQAIDAPKSENMIQKGPGKTKPAGRPSGSKDTVKRDKSRRSRASLLMAGSKQYTEIAEWVRANCLELWGLSNTRQMSSAQDAEMDSYIIGLFGLSDPGAAMNSEAILDMCQSNAYNSDFIAIYEEMVADAGQENLTMDQKKALRIAAYAEYWVLNYNADI